MRDGCLVAPARCLAYPATASFLFRWLSSSWMALSTVDDERVDDIRPYYYYCGA
jgi:hypothetical protein